MPFLAILSFLKNNWLIFAAIAMFYAGWHGHTWYDGYIANKIEIKAVDSLGKGEAKIIDINQKINKEKSVVKDSCLSKPIPTNISRLLR